MASTTFTMQQVSQHKTKQSLWMVIDNKVYDVTNFISEHPGGEETIMDVGGEDATEAFEDIGHSDNARNMLKDYYIGDLDLLSSEFADSKEQKLNTDGLPITNNASAVKHKSNSKDQSPISKTFVVFGVLIGASAYYLYKYYIN